jgi:hypothetical protein
LRPAPATAAVTALVNPDPGADRILAPELARVEVLVRSGTLVQAAGAQIGELL